MTRCHVSGKVSYCTRGKAYGAVHRTKWRSQRAYRCPDCNKFHLTKSRLGNAVVPQVAEAVGRMILNA